MITEKQLLDFLIHTTAIGGAIGAESQKKKTTGDQLVVGIAGAAIGGYLAYKIGQRLLINQNEYVAQAASNLKSITYDPR